MWRARRFYYIASPLVLACSAKGVLPTRGNETAFSAEPSTSSRPLETPCAILSRARQTEAGSLSSCFGQEATESLSAIGSCLPTRSGAWGLLPTLVGACDRDLSPIARIGARAEPIEVTIAYIRGGDLIRGERLKFARSSAVDVRTFDYDGDGTEELLLSGKEVTTARLETRSRIFRWIGERIEPLPTPLDAPVIAFRDIDQDGRPDLLLEDLLSAYDGDVDSHRLLVSRTAAHSLPGGQFSTNDGAVHAFIRKECEGRTIESAEAADLMAAAGCARRSNVPIAEITLRYQKRCRTLVAISPTRGGRWAGRPGAHPSDEESVGDYSLTPMCSIGHLPGQATFEGKLGVPTDLRERLLAMTPLPPP